MYRSGLLIEYAETIGGVIASSDGVYFLQYDRIWFLKDPPARLVREFLGGGLHVRNGRYLLLDAGGVWYKNNDRYCFFDLFGRGISVPATADLINSEFLFAGSQVILKYEEGPGSQLVIKDLETSEIVSTSEQQDYLGVMATRGDHLYILRKEPFRLMCLDLKQSPKWCTDLPRLDSVSEWGGCRLVIHQQTVVLAAFNRSRFSQHEDGPEFYAVALDLRSGSVRWEFNRSGHGGCFNVCERYLCASVNERALIVDMSDGTLVVEINTDFDLDWGHAAYQVGVYLVNEHIMAWQGNRIKIYSLTSQDLLQEIVVPAPRTAFSFGSDWHLSTGEPAVFDDKVYLYGTLNTGLSGLLILQAPTEDGSESCEIVSRIPYRLTTVPASDGTHGYRIYYSHDDFDELVRCLHFQLLEISQYLGQTRVMHDHYDPDLNGQITLAIDANPLPSGAETRLRQIIEDLEYFFEVFSVHAPAVEDLTYLRVSLQLVDRPEPRPGGIEIDSKIETLLGSRTPRS